MAAELSIERHGGCTMVSQARSRTLPDDLDAEREQVARILREARAAFR